MASNYTTTSQWRRLRLQILERDGYLCQIRGPKCKLQADQVDHIVPTTDGGPIYDPTNLRAACRWCNNWRAQRQKSREGWRRSGTHIVLVMGPICAGKTTYVREHMTPGDLVVDYDAIAAAIWPGIDLMGGGRHKLANEIRTQVIKRIRRGEVAASRAWIITADPKAASEYPHHEIAVVDPGRDEVMRRCEEERPVALHHLVDEWYRVYEGRRTEPSIREW